MSKNNLHPQIHHTKFLQRPLQSKTIPNCCIFKYNNNQMAHLLQNFKIMGKIKHLVFIESQRYKKIYIYNNVINNNVNKVNLITIFSFSYYKKPKKIFVLSLAIIRQMCEKLISFGTYYDLLEALLLLLLNYFATNFKVCHHHEKKNSQQKEVSYQQSLATI